jgi:catechol-2,3-dioxygenase
MRMATYYTTTSAGLFHFAILVPDRKSLASTYLALRDAGVEYDGFADHLGVTLTTSYH